VVLGLGVASILYGSVQAVARRSAGEVLAYSSIGQAGYVLVALAIGGPIGYAAAVLYALVNGLNKALLFLSAEARGWLVGGAFAIGALSVAGVPPSAGFFGKLAIFDAAIAKQSPTLVALVFLGGALSFVYMFQLYQHDFWAEGREALLAPRAARVLIAAVAALVVAVGLWPEPLLEASSRAAAVLPGGAG
jgi:multicomponent Na+:H+ antiporter subunit D